MLYPCDCRHTLVAILPWFVNTCQERALDEVSLHTLTSSLAAWQEEFTHPDFCDVVFDQFLLPLVSHTSVMRHTLRLLSYIFPKLDPQKVLHILTIAQPSSEVCTMYSWFCVVFFNLCTLLRSNKTQGSQEKTLLYLPATLPDNSLKEVAFFKQ